MFTAGLKRVLATLTVLGLLAATSTSVILYNGHAGLGGNAIAAYQPNQTDLEF